jgi:transcriptional regulator with XRE-family HTH domain
VIGGELVREARKRAGMTQAKLADLAGTTQSSIARLESGRSSPSFEQVERLMRLCGFQLIVELAPYDDSDIVQAEALLRMDMGDRAVRLEYTVRHFNELRQEFDAARVT